MANIDWKAKDEAENFERVQLQAFAPQVAALLGAGWSVKPHRVEEGDTSPRLPTYYTLSGPDGASIDLSGGTYDSKGRVTVTVNFSDRVDGDRFWSLPHNVSSPRATIAGSRGPHAIATEIARRVFPAYMPLLIACNTARAEYIKTRDAKQNVADDLARYIGGSVHNTERAGTERTVNVYRSTCLTGAHFDLKVTGGWDGAAPSVRFDRVDVPAHVARQILDVLVQHHIDVRDAAAFAAEEA